MSAITQSDQQSEVANAYRIYSRWLQWARWRIVTPLPHSEHRPFDSKGLAFTCLLDAQSACQQMREANEGDFEVVLPCGCFATNRDICTHGGHGTLA